MRYSSMHLERQIERIADEATTNDVSVIVQMAPHDSVRRYLQATAEALRDRSSIVTARALVPPTRDELGRGKTRARLQRSRSPVSGTFRAGQVAPAESRVRLRTESTSALKPLMKSSWYKEAARATRGRRKSPPAPMQFWSGDMMVMTVSKDHLAKLVTEVPQLAEVFPNRRVTVPPTSKAAELPFAVTDNKAYTWGLSRTGAMACWGAFGAKGRGARVAVLDTGVDPKHPDLKGKIAGFAEFDDQGRTIVDNPSRAYDSDEHGTHCAGTIVGGNASGRWIGMAPEAEILAGLVLKGGSGTDAQILAGIEWAIAKGAHVISMSLGGLRMTADVLDTYTRSIINANRLGIPVVVAIGNEGSQTSGSPGNDYFAFTVGATDSDDRAAGFSGGRTQIIETSRYINPSQLPVVYSKPEVSAPGVDIYSAVPGKKWEAWNGTSMATPHVAGAMALLLSGPSRIGTIAGADRTNLLQTLLLSTVKELGEAGQNHRFGHGRVDVLRAFGYAQELGYLR